MTWGIISSDSLCYFGVFWRNPWFVWSSGFCIFPFANFFFIRGRQGRGNDSQGGGRKSNFLCIYVYFRPECMYGGQNDQGVCKGPDFEYTQRKHRGVTWAWYFRLQALIYKAWQKDGKEIHWKFCNSYASGLSPCNFLIFLYSIIFVQWTFIIRMCWIPKLGKKKKQLKNFGFSSAAAASPAKSLQSCPTLCDPIDGSPLGSSVPGILQARTLEWVAISFSNAWRWKVKVKSLSPARLLATPWTAAYQAPPSMGFSRQEYWSGLPLNLPLPNSVTLGKFLNIA